LAFARALHTPKLYDLIKDAERVSDFTSYRFPTSVRRHYERLTTFPEGFVVLGDAISSFNPFYGQGMSSAALQVQALQQELRERGAEARTGRKLAQSRLTRTPASACGMPPPTRLDGAAQLDYVGLSFRKR
jgi:2-polyprenyl-6-methoxyphenol hydroxylase-like FAD-dependent oxidoreductase